MYMRMWAMIMWRSRAERSIHPAPIHRVTISPSQTASSRPATGCRLEARSRVECKTCGETIDISTGERRTEVKLWPKDRSLQDLARIKGAMKDSLTILTPEMVKGLTDEELEILTAAARILNRPRTDAQPDALLLEHAGSGDDQAES